MRTSRKALNRFLTTSISVGVASLFLLSGCAMSPGIPGLPDIKFDVPDSAAQSACKAYASAWSLGTTRGAILTGLENAEAIALAGNDDDDAAQVALVIDGVLAMSVIGTQDSLSAANDRVIAVCGTVGVNIEMAE